MAVADRGFDFIEGSCERGGVRNEQPLFRALEVVHHGLSAACAAQKMGEQLNEVIRSGFGASDKAFREKKRGIDAKSARRDEQVVVLLLLCRSPLLFAFPSSVHSFIPSLAST